MTGFQQHIWSTAVQLNFSDMAKVQQHIWITMAQQDHSCRVELQQHSWAMAWWHGWTDMSQAGCSTLGS